MSSPAIEQAYDSFPPDWSLGVMYAGSEACEPGHLWEGIRDHVVLHLVTAGSGTFRSGKRSYDLGRGDLFLIRPATYVHYQASTDTPWSYRWIGYDGLHAVELTDAALAGNRRPVVHLTDAETAARMLADCLTALETRDGASQLRAVGLLYSLLGEIRAQSAELPPRTEAADLIGEACAFMDQNYHREIGVLDVARHIGIDRSHFSRVFRQQTGASMQDYLIGVRMRKALRLLRESSLPIKAVAGSVGYRSYHSFCRRFLEFYGCSPTAARSGGPQDAPASSSAGRSVTRERRDSASNP